MKTATLLAALAIAVAGCGSSDDSKTASAPTATTAAADTATAAPTETVSAADVKLPAQKIKNLGDAAKAAGCAVNKYPIEGRDHEDKVFTASDYKTNPPTSGNHFPQWAQDGIYDESNLPQLGMLVHTLEHGRIDVQYQPGASAQEVAELTAFVGETKGFHELLYPNPTNMTAQVAATAWGYALTCPKVNDNIWDALRAFRDARVDKGPELIP